MSPKIVVTHADDRLHVSGEFDLVLHKSRTEIQRQVIIGIGRTLAEGHGNVVIGLAKGTWIDVVALLK